jgi:hypothetical protein
MTDESLAKVRTEIGERIAYMRSSGARLSPLDIYARMDAIRAIAAGHGLAALEGLAHCSAQLALLPGHRIATRSCLDHMADALASDSAADTPKILAALAVRLH